MRRIVFVAVSALVALGIAVPVAQARASTIRPDIGTTQVAVGSASSLWYLDNCQNASGYCTTTQTPAYEASWTTGQTSESWDGEEWYSYVNDNTGQCLFATTTYMVATFVPPLLGDCAGVGANALWHWYGAGNYFVNLEYAEYGDSDCAYSDAGSEVTLNDCTSSRNPWNQWWEPGA